MRTPRRSRRLNEESTSGRSPVCASAMCGSIALSITKERRSTSPNAASPSCTNSRRARQGHLMEMASVAAAVFHAVDARKMNYQALGNSVAHLHWWLTPRHRDDPHPRGRSGKSGLPPRAARSGPAKSEHDHHASTRRRILRRARSRGRRDRTGLRVIRQDTLRELTGHPVKLADPTGGRVRRPGRHSGSIDVANRPS